MAAGEEMTGDAAELLAASALYRASLAAAGRESPEQASGQSLSAEQVSRARDLLLRLGLARPVEAGERELAPIAPDVALRACLDAGVADATRLVHALAAAVS